MLVTGTDLNIWANRRDAQGALPQLVRRLIHATVGRVLRIGFPAGDAVQMGGWDGIVVVEEGNAFVPDGRSVWELGTNRDVKGKADGDYEKRVADPLGLDPAETAFVFVTPRRWGGKDDWIATKQEDGIWREVRAYDAADLEEWLELAPAVHVWLSILLGKQPEGAADLSSYWRDWSESTDPPLSSRLITSGREEGAEKILGWIRAEPAILSLRADSREEALAFFLAVLHDLPLDERIALLSRGAVVQGSAAWRHLSASQDALLLVAMFDERAMVAGALRNGHHVLVPLGRADARDENAVELPRLSRCAAVTALEEMGFPAERARPLATLARRSLMSLRRHLALSPAVQQPAWANPAEAGALLPVILTGAWDDSREGDRAVLEALARRPYHELSRVLARWANESDPPVRRVGDTWLVVSRDDAWSLLARFLDREDLERFGEMVVAVLATSNPAFDLPPDQRWMAGMLADKPRHSGLLSEGLAGTLALMSARSETTTFLDGSSGQERANGIAKRLLAQANDDWRIWASIAHLLPALAEAAPAVVLESIEAGLSGEEPPLLQLFSEPETALFGGSPHVGLLWALEVLAWNPAYLGHASLLLARLARMAPPGKTGNRPDQSLKEIFSGWRPGTAAQLDQQLRVLDALREREPSVAWWLLTTLIPKTDVGRWSTAVPRWRDWAEVPEVAPAEYWRGIPEIISRLLEDVGSNGERWKSLVQRVEDLPSDLQERVTGRLLAIDVSTFGSSDRMAVWGALHEVISRHREFPDADWILPGEVIERLEAAYHRFDPDDLIARHARLFAEHPQLLTFSGDDFDEKDRQVAEQRRVAMSELEGRGGLPMFLELAQRVEDPWGVGSSLGESDLLPEQDDELLRLCLDTTETHYASMAQGFVSGRFRRRGWAWVEETFARGYPAEQQAAILAALPFNSGTWDRVEAMEGEVQRLYWLRAGAYAVQRAEEAERGARKLLEYGRPFTAINLLARYARQDPPAVSLALVAEALEQCVRADAGADGPRGTFSYSVGRLLRVLERTEAIDETRLAALEWAFLPLIARREHGPKVLYRELSRNPEFFVEIVTYAYVAEDEEPLELSESELARGQVSLTLLHSWKALPGLDDDGSTDPDELVNWVFRARELLSARGREGIGDILIGRQLRYASAGQDGAWPAEPLRDLIERLANEEIEQGLITEVLNSRGMTTRSLTEGGEQERALEAEYQSYAAVVGDRWPRTAAILRRVANIYGHRARREDTEAELREDLGP